MPCNDGTVLAALPDLCAGIAHACTTYADAADHARHQAQLQLAAAAVPLGLLDGGALILTPETSGGSDAIAAGIDAALIRSILIQVMEPLVAIATALAAGALADHIIHATDESAARAPQVRPTDADGESVSKSTDGEVRKTKEQAADQAAKLGYKRRIPPQKAPFNSHGQDVFTDGKKYLTRDADGHNASNGWKLVDRRGKRVGSYDWNGNRVKG